MRIRRLPAPLSEAVALVMAGFKERDDLTQPPNGMRIPVVRKLEAFRELSGFHQAPRLSAAIRPTEPLKALPIDNSIIHASDSGLREPSAQTAGMSPTVEVYVEWRTITRCA
jgi:hypothetical protein